MIRFLQSGNKAAKYILAGFLLILTASMVTYLIPGFMSDTTVTQSGVVASVGGQDVKSQDVTKLVQVQMQAQHYPPQLAPFLSQRVVQELIQRAEVRYEANRIGLRVSDEELRDELRNGQYKQVFFPGGNWIGQDKYEKLLEENNTSVSDFERSLREELLARKLFNTIAASVSVAPSEVEQAYKDKNTKVKFTYAMLSLNDIKKQINPTEAELKAYFEANKARYQNSIPEKRQIRYFVLNDKDAESKVTVWPAGLGGFPKMMMANVALYGYLVVKPIGGVGYDLRPKLHDLRIGLREFLFYAPVVLSLGFLLGFLHWEGLFAKPAQFPAAWIFTFFFVALPEELFFRGLLQNLLERHFGKVRALWTASCIFGLSHFNKGALFNWRYVLLASIAGLFYGRAWRQEGRLMASSVTHSTVDAVWSIWFR